MKPTRNTLRLGDNLPLLRDRGLFPDESVDLIYADPPLNPHRGSHVAAREIDTGPANPLIPTPVNIWRWNEDAAARYEELLHAPSERLRAVMMALRTMLGQSAMFAYLVHMTPRLQELHRVLKKSGSFVLHCDPIASHYLKIVLDAIFGQKSLVNEIVWKRVASPKDIVPAGPYMGRIHDILLYYRKSDRGTFNVQTIHCSDEYMDHFYPHTDVSTGKRFRLGDVTAAKSEVPQYDWRIKRQGGDGPWKGDWEDEWKNPVQGWTYKLMPPVKNRFWALPRELAMATDNEGLIVYSRIGYPQVKRFATAQGIPVQDIWTDIPPVIGADRFYTTQKPRALLERIISMASNPGDVILDPFCGSGPTMGAIEAINRQSPDKEPRTWIGIETSYLASTLIKHRLSRFMKPSVKYRIIGDIKDIRAAEMLAARDDMEFQYWAFGLVGARPWGYDKVRKSPERCVDGVRLFADGTSPVLRPILIQVKNGNVKLEDVRGLEAFRRRTKSPMGVFISLQDPTKDAIEEAAQCGTYFCQATRQTYPRIQVTTVEQLLAEQGRQSNQSLLLPPRSAEEAYK